jgi:hypothetical protein
VNDVGPNREWDYASIDAAANELRRRRWRSVVPLWTTDEAPSDLSAEIRVMADGQAEVVDVHVL